MKAITHMKMYFIVAKKEVKYLNPGSSNPLTTKTRMVRCDFILSFPKNLEEALYLITVLRFHEKVCLKRAANHLSIF